MLKSGKNTYLVVLLTAWACVCPLLYAQDSGLDPMDLPNRLHKDEPLTESEAKYVEKIAREYGFTSQEQVADYLVECWELSERIEAERERRENSVMSFFSGSKIKRTVLNPFIVFAAVICFLIIVGGWLSIKIRMHFRRMRAIQDNDSGAEILIKGLGVIPKAKHGIPDKPED